MEFARTGDPDSKEISVFVGTADAPGVSNEPLRTTGRPGWKLRAPKFEHVEVPAENLIGEEGEG